ncbi:deadenylation-dependent mRNA-decapping factor PAT1 [Aspergillus vadensis CBS 113365]|uniref:Topoisomerase II associated protein n=1 Tax=Aspergillus vadensis (strain CBS 113365 / IMI 142717 / IBT 24658) TaxID=1448311 RepID=A0A319C3S3_ASPVC|nr:topoisomerase II associated protein [Aspergillus vadensis CBS 113365]PYH72893.1 topoisomerase II associated protein [Aspergillus vadensis CBS 113365]
MSFFGFNTTLPRDRAPAGEQRGIFDTPDPFAEVARARLAANFRDDKDDDVIDFEDTYDGLGDQLDDDQDAFNDDTFGGGFDTGPVGKDFDFFGKTAQVADVIGEEQIRYSLQKPGAPATAPSQPTADTALPDTADQKPKRSGYEKYNDPGYIPDLQAKSSVWGMSKKPEQQFQQQLQQLQQPTPQMVAQAKKMLSLEEVEAQLRRQGPSSLPAQIPLSLPQSMPEPTQPLQRAQMPPLPEGFPQLPPEILQAQFAKGVPPALLQHQPPMVPEPYPLPPNLPIHMLQNANLPPQHMVPPQRQAMPQAAQRPQQQQPPLPQAPRGNNAQLPVITNSQQLMHLTEEQRVAYLMEDAKRAKRNHKIFLLSRGNGLMTPQDKNFITRIQLQQLVAAAGNVADSDAEAVLAEDFYYQVYSQIRGAPRQHPHQPLGHFAQTYLLQTGNRLGGHGSRRQFQSADNHMQRMQQQVQRAVEAAKQKPKNKQLIIEGSLGKISFSNAKTPKPMLNIKRPESSEGAKTVKKPHTDLSVSDRKSVLTNLESVYSTLMDMEDMERTMPPPPDENDPEAIQKHMEWRQKIRSLNQKLWRDLKVMEPIVPNTNTPHPFIAFLAYPKGKKAIPRIFRHIDQEQRVTILTMIVVHLDSLDVVRRAQPVPGETQPSLAVREAIELFSQAVMPSLLGYVNEAPFNIIIGLLGLVIAQTHVQMISRTRIGLGILTMLLSRAEIVKEAGQATERDWQQWVEKFNVLFDTLEPTFADIFPSAINAGDDMYVWQFLAAVGIGASPEQQQRLVIAVKDRVMETVTYSKTLPADMASARLGNVNLFMRAIGLDVELLG